ncbi:MAG: hypothetical protein M3381_01050 [Actinomycetota bacterium]|nr:hypothetical protein [Actinomycetota bacterium]
MRQRLLGCCAIACLLVSIVGCGNNASPTTESGEESAASESAESSPYSYDTLEIGGREAISVRIPGDPDYLAADDEHVYVRGARGFNALDPETAEVLSSFEIDGQPCNGVGAAAGTVWTCSGTDVVGVEAGSDDVQARLPVTKASEQGHLVIGFGRVWVLLGDGGSLLGIDTDSNEPGEAIVLPVRGTDLAISADRIWVVSSLENAVVEVDPSSGAVGRRIDGLTGARAAVAVPGALWVGGASASYRIDVATGAVTATVNGGVGYVGAISADDSSVWVRKGGVTLQHLDAATGALLEEISEPISDDVAGGGGDALVAFGALWVTFFDDATLIRIPLG